jgi:hypothetical protein
MSRPGSRYNARQTRRFRRKSTARYRPASVSATRRRMISATGRISLIAPAGCPADHYAVSVVQRLRRGSPNTASPARDWCRGTRHVGDKDIPSPSSHRNSRYSRQSLMAAPVSSPLAENENRRSIVGLQATLYARFATQSCSSRRQQRAAAMGRAEVPTAF